MQDWAEKYFGNDPYIETLKSNFDKGYHVGPTGRLVNDSAEAVGAAGDFIDAWLKAKQRVQIFDYPGGTVKAVFEPGEIIGKVYSYKLYNGSIWWQLDDPTGKHYGWVRHVQGFFEPQGGWAAEDEQFRREQEEREKENNKVWDVIFSPIKAVTQGVSDVTTGAGKALSSFGNNLNTIIILALIGVALYAFVYAKKTFSF